MLINYTILITNSFQRNWKFYFKNVWSVNHRKSYTTVWNSSLDNTFVLCSSSLLKKNQGKEEIIWQRIYHCTEFDGIFEIILVYAAMTFLYQFVLNIIELWGKTFSFCEYATADEFCFRTIKLIPFKTIFFSLFYS